MYVTLYKNICMSLYHFLLALILYCSGHIFESISREVYCTFSILVIAFIDIWRYDEELLVYTQLSYVRLQSWNLTESNVILVPSKCHFFSMSNTVGAAKKYCLRMWRIGSYEEFAMKCAQYALPILSVQSIENTSSLVSWFNVIKYYRKLLVIRNLKLLAFAFHCKWFLFQSKCLLLEVVAWEFYLELDPTFKDVAHEIYNVFFKLFMWNRWRVQFMY